MKYIIKVLLIKLFSLFSDNILLFLSKFKYIRSIPRYILSLKYSKIRKLFIFSGFGLPLIFNTKIKLITLKQKGKNNYSILKECNIDITNQKVALLAHYDSENVIDKYVLNYIDEISKLGYKIFVISTNKLKYDDNNSSIDSIILRDGKGYDFTSWFCAFAAYPELFSANELLLCNDSVFGPINSLKPIHEQMNSKECNFWGLSDNTESIPHLQSYYLVFKTKAIQSNIFYQLFSNNFVTSRKDAIFMELHLTSLLYNEGLIPFTFISSNQLPLRNLYFVHYFWEPLIKWCGFPFLKRDLLMGKTPLISGTSWKKVLKDKNYNTELILNYINKKKRRKPSLS